ncbi:MAG: hypothetical protein ABI321_13355 [Polyangia bacterium]
MGATFVMSYPAADWHVAAGQNRRSASAKATASSPREALREWMSVADTILRAGGRIIVLDPPKGAGAGLVYAADWGAVVRRNDQALFLAAMGTGHRASDAAPVGALFVDAGVEVATVPMAWGGRGDLLQAGPGRYLYLAGARTAAGAAQHIARELGTVVRFIEARVAPPFEFGDEVATMLTNRAGDSVMLVHENGMSGRTVAELRAAYNKVEVISVDDEDAEAGACTALDVNGTVILPTGLSTAIRGHLVRRGFQTVELELPQLFGRGGGGPHALVNELIGFVMGTGAPDYTRARDRIAALVDTYPESVAPAASPAPAAPVTPVA